MSLPHQKLSLFTLAKPRPQITVSPAAPLDPLSMVSPSHLPSSRKRHSTDSWNSIEDDLTYEWTSEQISRIVSTLEGPPSSHLASPYTGSIPPSNLLDRMGRSILDSLPPEQWPHSLRSTRLKLIQVAKQLAKQPSSPTLPSPRVPQRGLSSASRVSFPKQNSMDYLPVVEEQPLISPSKSPSLKRSERVTAHAPFHPYERPSRPKTRSTADPSPLSRNSPTRDEKRKCTSSTRAAFNPSSDSLLPQSEEHTTLPPAYLNIAITLSPSSSTSSLVSKRIPSYKNHSNQFTPIIETKKRTRKRSKTKPGSLCPTTDTSEKHRATRKRVSHLDDENVFTPDMDDTRSFSELSLGSSFAMDDSRPSSRRSRRLTPHSRCGTPLSIASSVEGESRSPRRLRRSRRLSLYRGEDDEVFGDGSGSGTRRMVGRKISFGSDGGYEAGKAAPMTESSNGKLVFGGLLQAPFEG